MVILEDGAKSEPTGAIQALQNRTRQNGRRRKCYPVIEVIERCVNIAISLFSVLISDILTETYPGFWAWMEMAGQNSLT